ncbi:tRNA (adenosine(37)-N6)-threonylcarbamoyltransferase complex ATPase subunit type 1 TsaE [Lactobacillus kefiranofaciens]|uniref:tRNA threonylcarbamoyladenosine biosynthesis protein TsaE n=1 Tax=Lactobacillus kefiranofaciens TaxID=267818 RepID=A0AAX3UEK1_9LACO|nr:tRNA (adenosine(37)-N6)-threonylcarbamoyltransferase complex ATPase subunit type 1 TsaE [Lactobacillus kefiranofaciens]AEG40642.1 ATPase or kinase [Lactobacillus kefiranofaciens subsp. kefiranofaciens]KRM22651.1 ATPase or kinase [Lactobacillus kefiranofaciens subsp. kefiranofaciens DSM 5016 = JCM 6985]QFQ68159.1 tRNA (adenosine(37)-N6)-threonylcarbamoyltransferase complex ATPase subunit type 1 TsaE [Lactobacillus kefiranofaciens subsp. kefiranofaciens]WGO86056.1 tRNA (adenosine(37)-N6)-threo
MTKLEINSAESMQKLGASLAKTAKPHDLLLLNGDLGAGKTTMTQGLGRELGVRRPVKSPTFTIVREYREARLPLFYMDFYRLEDDDLSSIDLEGYLAEPGLIVIEWPQLVMNDLPNEYLQLTLTRVDDSWESTKRVVKFDPHGKRNEEWVKAALTEYDE